MKTKLCKACNENKEVSAFWKDRSNKEGYFAYCKACAVEKRDNPKLDKRPYVKRAHMNGNGNIAGAIVLSEDGGTSLAVLRELPRNDSRSIRVDEARDMMSAYVTSVKTGSSLSDHLKRSGIQRGPATCRALMAELRRADKDGMTLEQYFEKGRPYKLGNKVLAGSN